jgi:hypothetical protein|tara:strand:- start:8408 stop:9391 length:984 start_codon:yes stop_codon:yes gene_type:complete
MANSTSASLKLTVQATGENSGTWGQITNTNLLILEQAIGGYQTVDAASGATLAFTNGAVSNGKNAVIKLTGTISGNVNVVVPDGVEKTYIVHNGTSGAHNVVFKTSSGTGFTFSGTEKNHAILYSDGTNIVEVNNNLAGLIVGTDVQAYDAQLADIAGLAVTDGNFIVGNGSNFVAENGATARASLALDTGNDVQFDSFGVGTAASGTTGQIRATDDITAFYSSDESLKENVVNIPNPLEAIKKLNGVTFDWKPEWLDKQGGEDGYFVRKRDVGVIAQDVEKVLPEAVAKRSNGIKAVKYDRLTCLLIEAVKKLQDKVDTLSAKKGN